ncbi:unnamed protein product [Meloidogyne enterolobii]|uniref:Uncharacterized protein n=2 Tax=Meloidogyne enterolobii TaxID=390850 RepID=A0ACB0XXG1_MELEN
MGGQISSSGSGENFNTTRSFSSSSRNSSGGLLTSPGLSSIGSSGRKSRHWRTPSSCSNSASPPQISSSSSFSSAGCTPYLSEQQQNKQQFIRHPSLSKSSIRSSISKGRQKTNSLTQWKALPSPSPFADNYANVNSFIGAGSKSNRLPSSMLGHNHKSQHGSNSARSGLGSNGKSINGPSTFVSRWGGSFTRALPGLKGGGGGGNVNNFVEGRHLMAKSLIKEQTTQQRRRHLPSSKNRKELIENSSKIEDNNNNNIYVNNNENYENDDVYKDLSTLTISNNYSSNNFKNTQEEKNLSEKEVHWRRRKILENNSNSKDFSLKSSLKRSGSKLFNGLLRSLIGEDENEEEEKEEELEKKKNWEKEDEEEEEGFNDNFKNRLYLDDNNNKTTILNNLPHKHKTATISTSSLRASLYQAKKRMLPKCTSSAANRLPNKNGNVEIFLNKRGDGELVSSMLLSMATCPSVDSSISNRRPFSAPTDAYTSTNVKKSKDLWLSADWSGGNEKTKFLDNLSPLRQRRKIIQANSGELIKAIGYFICQHCCWYGLHEQFEPAHLGTWLRSVDRALILQGWQDVAFINPANLVFLFMLIRDAFLQGFLIKCEKKIIF